MLNHGSLGDGQGRAVSMQEPNRLVLPGRKHLLFVFLLLAALIGTIYSNTLDAGYHLDDRGVLCLDDANGSSDSKGLGSKCCDAPYQNLSNLVAIWNERPTSFLTFLTFALNYYFGGANVVGYHLVNISIHIATSFVVYLFALMFFQTPRLRNHPLAEYANTIALFSSLFFAAHPIQIGAVTYIAQRVTSFATLFYISTCFFYVLSRVRQSKKLYWVAVLFCAASIFTKEITFTLPGTIAMCEFFLFSRGSQCSFIHRLARLAPFFLVTTATIPLLQNDRLIILGPLTPAFERTSAASLTWEQYLCTQFNVMATYLRMLFWPYDNTLYHNFPFFRTLMEPKTLSSLGLLVTLFLTAFGLRKKQPVFAFGIFWFFLTFIPYSSGVFKIRFIFFTYRMYLPMIGLCLAFSTILVTLFKKQRLLIVISAVLLLALCFTTYQQNKDWKTDRGLVDKSLKLLDHKTVSGFLFEDLPRACRDFLKKR